MIEKQSRTVTDIRTHRLIYGCMGLGGGWDRQPYGPAEIDAAEAAIVAALEVGVTAFDHADIYRHGKSEAVFGEVLARTPGLRERILLQTKCGIHLPEGDRPGYYDLRGTHIRHSVEQSLTRLRTDVIDVLLLHRPDPLADPEDVAETLTALHREGLVRYFGVSNMAAAQIAYLQAHLDLPLIVNQLQMSLADRDWLEAGVLVNTPPAATLGFPSAPSSAACSTGSGCRPGVRWPGDGSPVPPRPRPSTPPPRTWRPWPSSTTPRRRPSCCGGCSGTPPGSCR